MLSFVIHGGIEHTFFKQNRLSTILQEYVYPHNLSSSIFTPILCGSRSVKDCIQLHVTETHLPWCDQAWCSCSECNKSSGAGQTRTSTGTKAPVFLALSPGLVALILKHRRQLFYCQTVVPTSRWKKDNKGKKQLRGWGCPAIGGVYSTPLWLRCTFTHQYSVT